MASYITCNECGQRNRIEDEDRPPPWCAKCGADRKAMRRPEPITKPKASWTAELAPRIETGIAVGSPSRTATATMPPPLPWSPGSTGVEPIDDVSQSIATEPRRLPPPLKLEDPSNSVPWVEPIVEAEPTPELNIALPKRLVFFEAIRLSNWGRSLKYRVYLTREDMLLIALDPVVNEPSHEAVTAILVFGGGLLGGMLASSLRNTEQNTYNQKVRLDMLSHADEAMLRDLATLEKQSLRVFRDDVSEMRLETPSVLHRLAWLNLSCAGLLTIRHTLWGKVRLQIQSYSTLMTAIRELPDLFGDRLDIDVDGYRTRRSKSGALKKC